MTPSGALSLADLVTAFARLRPVDDVARDEIGKYFGFVAEINIDKKLEKTNEKPLYPPKKNEDEFFIKKKELEQKPEDGLRLGDPGTKPQNKKNVDMIFQPEALPVEMQNTPAFSLEDDWKVFTPFDDEDDLFTPHWQRELLVAMSGASAPLGAVVIDRLVEKIARGKAVRHIPRYSRWSLQKGVQLLLDTSAAMLPYTYDQQRLLIAMKRLVSSNQLDLWRFHNAPWDQVRRSVTDPWCNYAPPPFGATVVLVSRFGKSCGEEMASYIESKWLVFLNQLRQAGHPIVLLTPYPKESLSLDLQQIATVVSWDRSTTVGGVLNQRRKRLLLSSCEREVCHG